MKRKMKTPSLCALHCGIGVLFLFAATVSRAWAFTPQQPQLSLLQRCQTERPQRGLRLRHGLRAATTDSGEGEAATAATVLQNDAASSSPKTTLKSYEYDGWNLTYRTIADNDNLSGNEGMTSDYRNVLLIHPVGIGLASWFWEPFLSVVGERNHSRKGTKIKAYAPNLIGCGISEGSDAWDPDKRGLFVPLGWVKGCEALMDQIEDEDYDRESSPTTTSRKWTVVTQGGLAPIGVLLAARNLHRIDDLVMASPPTWKDITTAVPEAELARNYGFLRSKILGGLAFSILETRGLIEFFSNVFLFGEEGCDETWLEKTVREMCPEARPPVQSFNAGMALNKGLLSELTETIDGAFSSNNSENNESGDNKSRLLIVQGENDKRPRGEYQENLTNCELVTLEGTTNVIPWEQPKAMVDLLFPE